jgi:hypothetical protein
MAISIANVKVINQIVSNTPISFSGAVGLKNLLTSLSYTPYIVTGGGGGGAVDSVNGQTGVVIIPLDYLPLAGGTMDDGADIFFDNGSKLSEGLYDEGTFGNKGIARTCAVGYEDKWEAGEQYITETGSGIIQFRRFAFNVPTVDDDVSKRYAVGSYWQMRNNDIYICTDATEGAAVWEIYNSFIPTLDQVLSEGFTGIDKSILLDTSLNYGYASLNYNQLNVVDADYTGSLKKSVLQFFDYITGTTVNFSKDGIGLITSAITGTNLSFENPTGLNSIVVPDKSGTLATLDDIPSGGGTVTSVGLTMPSAFTVTNSPITSSGDIAVTGAGSVSQYVRGDGTLANFPASSGGGSSLSFYLNGSVSQGTIGGVAFREMDRTPILGAGTDFTINANGYIQSFITDAGVPNLLEIPAGNWNFETYFSASSGGGSPSFYIELYKWDGTTLSLIASNSANPEFITGGTNTDLYVSALAVPQTTLLATDRLAVRIYVTHSGRTITLHTENSHLCQIITTFSTGLTALNGLTAQVQNFAVGTSGTDFGIVSSGSTHTFNLPNASAANRGALSAADWSTFNAKQNNLKTFNTTQGLYYFEDFMGGQAGSVTTSFGGVISIVSGVGAACVTTSAVLNKTNQQGVVRHTTGTTLSGFAGFALGNSSLFIGQGAISLETYVTIETLSNATERFFTFFGYAVPSNWQNNGNAIFFSYDEGGAVNFASGAASPNFKCYTKLANVTTLTTTSIPVVASQWYKLRIEINNAGNSVGFYIDGVLVATHTTNIPATTTGMSVVNIINKTVGITARTMQTDYFMYEEIFTTAR